MSALEKKHGNLIETDWQWGQETQYFWSRRLPLNRQHLSLAGLSDEKEQEIRRQPWGSEYSTQRDHEAQKP